MRAEKGMLALLADATLDQMPHPDVVVVPGGRATRMLVEDKQIIGWLERAHESSQWTTSVCTGSLLLGAAGILDGLQATTHWTALDTLARYGAHPVAQRVVEQDKVITAAGVSAGIDMALTLAAHIAGEQAAQAIQARAVATAGRHPDHNEVATRRHSRDADRRHGDSGSRPPHSCAHLLHQLGVRRLLAANPIDRA